MKKESKNKLLIFLVIIALLEYYITWRLNWMYYRGVIKHTHFIALVIVQILHSFRLVEEKAKATLKTTAELIAVYCLIPIFFIIQMPDVSYNEAKNMVADKHQMEEVAFIDYPSSQDTIHVPSTNVFLINRFYYFSLRVNNGSDLMHYIVNPSNGKIFEVEQYWKMEY